MCYCKMDFIAIFQTSWVSKKLKELRLGAAFIEKMKAFGVDCSSMHIKSFWHNNRNEEVLICSIYPACDIQRIHQRNILNDEWVREVKYVEVDDKEAWLTWLSKETTVLCMSFVLVILVVLIFESNVLISWGYMETLNISSSMLSLSFGTANILARYLSRCMRYETHQQTDHLHLLW